MASNDTLSWHSSVMELSNGTRQPILSGNTTADVSGGLVADTVYHIYWKSTDPTKWHCELASIWNTSRSSGKIRVATLTGAASGGHVQVKMAPTATVGGQDAINANQTVNQDSVTGTEIGTVGSTATIGLRMKMSTAGTGASGSGSTGNFLRAYTATSVSDTTGRWLDIDGDDKSIKIKSGIEADKLLGKFDATGVHFMNGLANEYILSGFNATGMKFYDGTSATITDATTRAWYSGSALTFYNASGKAAGNELLSLGVGTAQGLNLYGSSTSLTSATLLRFQSRVGGSWVNRGYQGLWTDGNALDHLLSYTPNSKIYLISGNAGSSTTDGSTIHFQTGEGLSAGWKIHASSDSAGTPVFRNYLFPVNSGVGSTIAGDLAPDGTSDEPLNYIGWHPSDTRDGQGSATFGPEIYAIQSRYIATGAGSAANPSLYYDANTGIYFPSTDVVGIAANGSLVAQFDSSGVTIQGALAKTAGTENIWIPAAAMTPRYNAGCAGLATIAAGTSGRPDFHVLDFDKDSDEHAQFTIAMPKSWDGGNVYFYAYWIGLAATTGVSWALQVLSLNDNEEFNQAYGTAVVVDDDSQGDATELLVSAKSGAIACSGADNDLLCFQVFRDVSDSNDDMAGDARLWGLLLEYTTSAATDA